MPEFSDHRSIAGRVGALTVVGSLNLFAASSRSLFFEGIKSVWSRTEYNDLTDLNELYALRWSVVKFPHTSKKTLIFETCFHGDWDQYLIKLVRKTAVGVDLHALGSATYPGTADIELFLAYLSKHHNPALHVYAANPMISPVDIDRFMPADDAPNAVTRMQGRWFGFLLPLKPNMLAQAQQITREWTNGDSPFCSALVQHGRIVTIEVEGVNFLLVSAVFVADPATNRQIYSRRMSRQQDQTLVEELVAGNKEAQWRSLLACADVPVTSRSSLVEAMLKNRYGHRATRSIRWVDWCWSFSPQIQRTYWQVPGSPTPKPVEVVARKHTGVGLRFPTFVKFGFDKFRASDED